MPAWHDLWLFLGASFVVWITPGPDTLYILGRTVAQGRLAGALSILGISVGVLAHTTLAAIGLSAVLAASALAFTVIKFVGAAYLIYLGIQSLRHRGGMVAEPGVTVQGRARILWQGFLTNLFNPKVALFFLAFLPQFVDPESGRNALAMMGLGGLFVIGGSLWSLLLVLFAARLTRAARANERVTEWLNKLVGVVFVALGLNLLRAKV